MDLPENNGVGLRSLIYYGTIIAGRDVDRGLDWPMLIASREGMRCIGI